jgi:methyl-CpG-binding domain protein 4
MQLDDTADDYEGIPSTPQQELSVVIHTTSKISMPLAGKTRSASIAAQENDDDKVSVFSMTNYGSLDWDHSGDESEFERASVSPKPKRRASSAHQTRRRPLFDTQHALPPQRKPRSKSCPAPVDRQALRPRDGKGRFARRVGKAAMSGKKEELNSLQRPSSSSSATQQQRDRRGRFAKTPSRSAARSIAVVEIPHPEAQPIPTKHPKAKKPPAKSPYFTAPISPPKTPKDPKIKQEGSPFKRSPGIVSCIPFPPLSAPHFGLIQEKLAHDPFRLLIAITFLIRTHGKHAIPVFYSLMSRYPTPQSLVEADKEDIVDIIRHLGLQNSRAATYQTYAKIWLSDPPTKGRRYAVKGYPEKDSGRDIARDEVIDDQDPRVAWEIGHMTSGPYALDSWRIFCRDVLRGVSTGWNGEGAKDGFQPEWMRVLPEDKELRAYLRWMWLKEGFEWDPFTGEKEVASKELSRAAIEGRIAWDDRGGMGILDEVVESGELVQGGLGALIGAGVSVESG